MTRWTTAREPGQPLGAALVEVAARLRAGADVETAWARALPPTVGPATSGSTLSSLRDGAGHDDGVPSVLLGLLRVTGGRTGDAEVAGAVAACRVAHRLGAPLADILERTADGLVESAAAESARRTALAGPRATARLLLWLPAVGPLLGAALGADPVAVLLGGGLGGACLVAGVLLLAAGHRWVAALVSAAERAESGG